MCETKARAVLESLGLTATPFGNPEVSAMAQICEILRQLPDDAARMRVMRWSFGRFNPDFKRLGQTPAPAQAAAVPVDPIADTDITTEIAAVAPDMIAPLAPRRREPTDFGRELSELEDLFPAERPKNGSAPAPLNLDVF